ncbi:MAG: nitroreductase family protein [Candidatus Heimdallarchaeota archaeon]|nr:MAG: nitroreductase family protein [Candidatus Heimdallarchaeota archaeon]
MIEVLPELCIKCGYCVNTCPSIIFALDQDSIKVEFEEYCILCGHCIAICPEDAIRHAKLDYTLSRKIPTTSKIDPQDLYTLFQTRRSIRNFKEKPIPKDLLERLISEARYAPTASNLQNVKYLIMKNQAIPPFVENLRNFYASVLKIFESSESEDPNTLRRIRKWNYWLMEADKGRDAIFYDPPAILVVYAPKDDSMVALNVGFAVAYLMLAAHVNGLGTLNIGYAIEAIRRRPKIAEELGVSPEKYEVFAVLSMGYPIYEYSKIPIRNPVSIIWRG